ncbi:MAG: NAD(P)-dependent glycerol-3-phosphate dehydrogenase [Desulfocapsaceae bacterium]|nr:NAD(P)-dependent glycerol-3-phosphate dehydrogenase [Desulfocapsaceae bacterium]
MKNSPKIAVIGAGSWGTAIAGVLSGKGYETLLWGHRADTIGDLVRDRENRKYLPGLVFPKALTPTADIREAARGAQVVCMVVPSHGFREVFLEIVDLIEPHSQVISAVKGIENGTLMTMSQIMSELVDARRKDAGITLSVLSGPSFAREVADGLPAAVTIGSRDIQTARELQVLFSTDKLRVYTSNDVIGIEICAAFKNIVAIAAGISDGIGFGLNARAAIITRGLAEICRLGMKMGAEKDTFSGLSGIGDLILTCTGDLSRNRSVGIKLGKGLALEEILRDMKMVAEGVKTTQSGYDLARRHQIEMPILEQVYQILYEKKDCATAVQDLIRRELKDE